MEDRSATGSGRRNRFVFGAAALLLDPAGPDPLVIDGEVLAQLAAGHRLVRIDDGFGWAMRAD